MNLLETMAYDAETGVAYLERHLARLKASAATLGFAFDPHSVRDALEAATASLAGPRRLRLLLSRDGKVIVQDQPIPPRPQQPVPVDLAILPASVDERLLRHKTSDRRPFEAGRATSSAFETLFVDRAGFLTQGSFTNIFLRRGAILLTPPATRAILPGVLRAELLAAGHAREGDLRPEDLDDGLLIGNALRGLIEARLIQRSPVDPKQRSV